MDHRAGEADLRFPGRDLAGHLGAVQELQAEADVWIVRPEALDEPGQEVLPGDRGRGNGNGALHFMGKGVERLDGPLPQLQNLLGIVVKQIPGIGGVDLLRGAYQQLDAQLPLQNGYMGTDGGLGQIQAFGGPGKASLVHHGHKSLQLLHINIHIVPPAHG